MKHQDDVISSNHIFAIVAEDREKLINKLKAYDIHPGVHYLRNDLYPMYKEGLLPNAQYFQERLLSLPVHLMLSDEDVQKVVDVIKSGW